MTDARTIDEMTYAEFDREYSIKPDREYISKFYMASNEDRFSDVIQQIEQQRDGEPVYFMGVVGGIDMAWNYMASLDPERSFLFDISSKPIVYQGLRMEALRGARRLEDYYGNLLCMTDEEKQALRSVKDTETLWEITSDYKPDLQRFAQKVRTTAKLLGYDPINDDVSDILGAIKFRRKSVHNSIIYANKLIHKKELRKSWMAGPNFGRLVAQAEDGRIRACRRDLYDGFTGFAQGMIDAYGIRNLVLYLSNVPEMHGNRKRNGASREITDTRTSGQRLLDLVNTFDDRLDRLWVVDSRNDTNRMIARKLHRPQQ